MVITNGKRGIAAALPFWMSLGFVPIVAYAAHAGGASGLLLPAYGWVLVSLLDAFAGKNTDNPDPDRPEADLFWYKLITLVWFPIQAGLVYGTIWWVTHRESHSAASLLLLFFGIGIASGTIGIVYAHELMHQKNRLERWLGDLLMASVLYGHFRSEHLLVHHLYVGTPRDAVTARYNEGFHRFFLRVLPESLISAWRAEAAMRARRGLRAMHLSNPFWRYGGLQAGFLALAWLAGGWLGLGLYIYQALVAIWQLELTNYVEHYGLTRKHLGEGRYERVLPRHSWNAAHRVSNWLLINLQRHSDHHYKPDRRFPLLQTYDPGEAPQLPAGYPALCAMAMVPPLWRRRMNPRVRAWRARHYPEVTDWAPYNAGTLPPPKGAP